MMKPHFNVVIATPGNSFTPGYLRSLISTISVLEQEKISWTFLNESGSFIPVVREHTIAGPYFNDYNITKPYNEDFTYDKIIWIDSDIQWSIQDFFQLYNSKKDILSGCYLMEDRTVPIYTKVKGPMMTEKQLYNKETPFQIIACGFGFIAMKHGVFEKMSRPWFGPVFLENSLKIDMIGEDLSWCTKATKSGFEIWADPNIRVIHKKSFNLYWQNN